MKEIIILMAEIVNNIHDVIVDKFGLHISDKALHFWIIGIIGIITFFFVHFIFKIVEKMKWNITILSFIYTFTVMVVLVFAIEIQQALTDRGSMEFADAVMGLWGFLVFFFVYAIIAFSVHLIVKQVRNRKS